MARNRSLLLVLLVFVAAAVGLAYVSSRQRVEEVPAGTPNVLLISIDTLRFDHLGCYGYAPPTSPELDDFRRDAVLFSQAIAQAPSTLPSHASMLTSLLPQHHGASYAQKAPLPEGVLTLAEVLQGAGFATTSFNNGGQVDASLGLGQGFDLYQSLQVDRFGDIVDDALDWLDRPRERPFFLFLHTYEVHHPYTPKLWRLRRFETSYTGPLPDQISVPLLESINRGELQIDDADLAHIEAAYDAEIFSMDFQLGRFVDELRKRGLYDNTLIVFTSDHGEEFGEHGWVGWHSHTLYDELLRVPLLLKLPGSSHAGETVAHQVRSIDIAPTVLDVVGIPVPEEFEGRSLLGLLDGSDTARRYAVSRRDTAASEAEDASIRTHRWKLYGGRLFDLRADPGEKLDTAALHPEIVQVLAEKLAELAGSRAPQPAASPRRLDDELRKRLQALGYD